jgi:hypothetical protein
MPFWRGETLNERLPSLVDPFDAGAIDCAAYTLRVGGGSMSARTARSVTLRVTPSSVSSRGKGLRSRRASSLSYCRRKR